MGMGGSFGRPQKNNRNVWQLISRTKEVFEYRCSVASCPGGAWSYFGGFVIEDLRIVASATTIRGIVSNRTEFKSHNFEFCDPRFPINFLDFLDAATLNAHYCFQLAYYRRWEKYRRYLRDTPRES